jgi:dynactin complex subunit
MVITLTPPRLNLPPSIQRPTGTTLLSGIPCIVTTSKSQTFKAAVRYIGPTLFAEGEWVGVEIVLGTLPKRVVEEEGAEGLECEWKWNNGAVGGVRYFELTIGEERGGISRSVSRAGTPEPNMRGSGAMVLLRPTSSASNSRREEEQEAVVAVERKGLFVRPNQVSLLSSSLFT